MNTNKSAKKKARRGPTPARHDGGAATEAEAKGLSRRRFLEGISGATAATLAASATGVTALVQAQPARAADISPFTPQQRRKEAFAIRREAALFQLQQRLPEHPCNGDEKLYPSKIGNYTKGLPHNSLGEVDLNAYNSLIGALSSGEPSAFEAIMLGGPRKLVNPQAGLAFDVEGSDSHQLAMRPAPALASAEIAGEEVELYWMALLRDVNFTDYDTHPLAQAAAAELSNLSDFRGPKVGGQVTTGSLFRGFAPGNLKGPFLSQFLLLSAPFGAEFVERRMRTVLPGTDYLTQYSEWLLMQNGSNALQPTQLDPVRRFIRNGRDLGRWVQVDEIFQAYFNARLALQAIGAPLNPGNPYNNSRTQIGFGTFGRSYITTIVCEVATRALKAVWFQKWFVHRHLRPEEYGGLVHNTLTGAANHPVHPDVLNSQAVAQTFSKYGSHLLPQGFTDGCPMHTSYGGGHATVAGACVTILKALFNENFVIPNPVVASADGLSLIPYTGADANQLTVGGELNKLAANIATGRDLAGIHYRSDNDESLKLGEAVAISVLRDQRATYNENFEGFVFTRFDGTSVTI